MSNSHLFEGRHCRIIIRPPLLIKDIEVALLNGLEFTEARAMAVVIVRRIRKYYELLQRAGMQLPSHHEVKMSVELTGVHVYETMNLGCNLEISPGLVQQVIRESFPVLLDPNLGLDLRIDNYVNIKVGRKANLCYIDLHPARFFEDGDEGSVYLVGFPQPSDPEEVAAAKVRYYDPIGSLRRFRFYLARETGEDWSKLIVSTVRSISGEVAEKLLERFQPIKGGQGVDDLRDLAVQLIGRGHPGLLETVYELTHVDFRLSPEERRKKIEDARRLLLENLK